VNAAGLSRALWRRYETIHDLAYFSPYVRRHIDSLGLRGFWMGYFAMRSAPLGRVDPAVITAMFYSFHRTRVNRALPDAWIYTTPEQAIAAREAAVVEALADVAVDPTGLSEAADLLVSAADAADMSGRPLAAAYQALSRPESIPGTLWQAAAVLREHRGDGHIAVLVSRNVTPAEAHRIKVASGEADELSLKSGRGYPNDEWESARATLAQRGWITPDGTLTPLGWANHNAIELSTDEASAQPWLSFGATRCARLLTLLDPIARAVMTTGFIPQPNPVGVLWKES
jgi:hypothetical protein